MLFSVSSIMKFFHLIFLNAAVAAENEFSLKSNQCFNTVNWVTGGPSSL